MTDNKAGALIGMIVVASFAFLVGAWAFFGFVLGGLLLHFVCAFWDKITE